MHSLKIILSCLVLCFNSRIRAADIPGYYWRDYTGQIPFDALPGGMENGSTTLIGQVLHKELLIPAKIVILEKKAYYEWGGVEYSTSKNVKVLCTAHPEQFDWIKTTSSDFNSIKDKTYVEAGYEPEAVLYIGRTYSQGDIILGKLLVNENVVLHISKDGRGIPTFLFEVLFFDRNYTRGSPGNKLVTNQSSQCEKRPVTINLFC